MRSITLMLVIIAFISCEMCRITPVYAKEKAGTTGIASYYHSKFHGRKTANGEKFSNKAFTCAHKKYPYNTIVKVKNLTNGKHTFCRINDRGPFTRGRIIDLSQRAARDIGLIHAGLAKVKVTKHCKPSKAARKYNAKTPMVKCVENP